MLSINFIRDNRELVIERLKIKNFTNTVIIDRIIQLDEERRNTQQQADQLQSEMNKLAKEIGELFKQGKKEEGNIAKNTSSKLKEEIKEAQQKQNQINQELNEMLIQIPNLPHFSVPTGNGEQDNQIERSEEFSISLPDQPLPHWELGKKYGILDFDLGNKITGSGFPVLHGKGARLQRALIQFFLEENTKAGYEEYLPPLLVNEASAFATGQLPDKEGQMYQVPLDNLYLIPTAEVPVTNIYRDTILNENDLPIKNTAYTPCFRREAGSYGKDVKGLNRVHQFDKVEIVEIRHPEESYEALEKMVMHVESLIKALRLPYRILRLCGGDISFTSALTYDFEVYAAAQQKWLEVSSVSNFESFQASRLKLRFREKGSKKSRLVHTLNGSALALPRILAALLENNQSKEGIVIPEVLRPYTGFKIIS